MTCIKDNLGEILLLIVLIVAIVLLSGCNPIGGESLENDSGFTYRIVEIEGMTCIGYESSAGYQGYGGLTCNWDEWRQ